MFLFIDSVSNPARYVLFDSERTIRAIHLEEMKWSESERFLLSLESFLASLSLKFSSLEGIIAVTGPGSFTAMRIITLTLNTISLVHSLPLYALDFFGFLECARASYPMLMKANRWEYLLKISSSSTPRLTALPDVLAGIYSGIGEANDFENAGVSIQWDPDYGLFCKNFTFSKPVKQFEPIYIKKPNII